MGELDSQGIEKFRAKQIAEWIYRRGISDFSLMSNLPLAYRNTLAALYTVSAVSVKGEQHSADHATSKFLLAFSDGMAVETVLMRQPYGNSVCVSTQVGCAMGCVFCASTIEGVERDLSGGEILAQVLFVDRFLRQTSGGHVNSIVIMGSGEPLVNYENVLRFIRLCHQQYALNLSYRSITLSTSGIVPGIYRLAEEGLPITLAISLHAPNDELRSQLMPVNKAYSLGEVIAAAQHYASGTGRRVTYEYTLIKGINDQPEHARQLAALLKGHLANVNLIPVNPVPERGLMRPSKEQIGRFENLLSSAGLNVTTRREMGADIHAACGQLRRRVLLGKQRKSKA